LLKEGDILIVRSGANVGDLGIVVSSLVGATFGSYVIRMRVRDIDPFYLYVYLKSKFGREQTVRFRSGAAQPNISIPNLKRVLVFKPSGEQQRSIKDLLLTSHHKRTEAEQLYAEAEALLLAELGLDALDLSHQPTYTQSFSQAWAAGRLDAEHFQPKYYTLLAKLQEMGQAVRLGDWLTEPIRRGVQPEYDENGDIIVINSQHVGKTHVEVENNRRTTQEFAEQNERAVVRRYDVLLNSTGYITIGRCQTLLSDVTAIVDGHVSILRPKKGLDPVYLGLFLNSLPGQMQTERSWTGSSGQIELRSELIEDYTVWKPDQTLQRRIRGLVEEAHIARKEAKRLLEEAKRRVEEMVLGE